MSKPVKEPPVKRLRGFALLSEERRREVAASGGKSAAAQGRGHRWTSEEARAAGIKSGSMAQTRAKSR